MANRVVSTDNLTTIKILQQPSGSEWIQMAIANLDTILLDHSHCERKAAGSAINLMFRYPSHQQLVHQLTAIAREELLHFEQVNQWLARRNIPLAALNSPPYFARLKSQVRHSEPQRLIDLLLVSAIIEARSHERLGLIGEHCPDPELAKFYRSLMASEARHYGIYWILAKSYSDRPTIEQRLMELGEYESSILATLHHEPRVHS
ncbi:MAG: tRNA-(ms[2]io[6]A)-hydroxylase [Cyanobacteria bacterium J06623_7]